MAAANTSSRDKHEIVKRVLFPGILGIEEIDTDLFLVKKTWKGGTARGTYGGQLIGQALMAASKTVKPGLYVHSMHSYFLRPGDTNLPIVYKVSRTRDGQSFSSRTVSAIQKGRPILTLQASFHNEEAEIPSVLEYQQTMPQVKHHSELLDIADHTNNVMLTEAVKDRAGNPVLQKARRFDSMDLKPVEPDLMLRRKQSNDGMMSSWFKVNGEIEDDPNMHRVAVAYVSDMTILQAALIRNSTSIAMIASLDHTIWFHRPFKADCWMLYEVVCPTMSSSRAICQGRIWTESGDLVATVAQEGIIRAKIFDLNFS